MDLRTLKLQMKFEKLLPFEKLRTCYDALIISLNHKYTLEMAHTSKEDEVYNLLREATSIKFHRSVWIGKRNIDLFCPCLTTYSKSSSRKSYKGLVIEVDGIVHDQQKKMNRDNSKYRGLHKLHIATYTIENDDLNKNSFKSFIKDIRRMDRLDSRGRKRVWRNIFIHTIISHQANELIKDHLTEEQLLLMNNIRGLQ